MHIAPLFFAHVNPLAPAQMMINCLNVLVVELECVGRASTDIEWSRTKQKRWMFLEKMAGQVSTWDVGSHWSFAYAKPSVICICCHRPSRF